MQILLPLGTRRLARSGVLEQRRQEINRAGAGPPASGVLEFHLLRLHPLCQDKLAAVC